MKSAGISIGKCGGCDRELILRDGKVQTECRCHGQRLKISARLFQQLAREVRQKK